MDEAPAAKGYLERLIATAVSPVRTIHPVVAPRLAPSRAGTESLLGVLPESYPPERDPLDGMNTEAVDVSQPEDAQSRPQFAPPTPNPLPLSQAPPRPLQRPMTRTNHSTIPTAPLENEEGFSDQSAFEPLKTRASNDPPSRSGGDRNNSSQLEEEAAPAAPSTAMPRPATQPLQPRRSTPPDLHSMGIRLPDKEIPSVRISLSSKSLLDQTELGSRTPDDQTVGFEAQKPVPLFEGGQSIQQTQDLEPANPSQFEAQSSPSTKSGGEPRPEPRNGTQSRGGFPTHSWPSPRGGDKHRRAPVPSSPVDHFASTRPDEINIHIGRIEVTAVHPPAAQPNPRPSRKSLNLDEYLRRSR